VAAASPRSTRRTRQLSFMEASDPA
jgi:hypothetical protein